MTKPLTQIAVENAKCYPDRRREIPDPALPGLYLVVQTTGSKSWALRYRFGGKSRKMTLGQYPQLTLKDARLAASEALEIHNRGTDPAARAAPPVEIQTPDDRDKISTLMAIYIEQHLSTIRTGKAVERELARSLLVTYGDRPVRSVTRREIRDLLETIRVRAPISANRVLTYIRAFYNWCLENDYCETNPTAGIKKPAKEGSRERVLSDDEIRWFFQACTTLGQPFGHLGKMLLLTGQRLGEVSAMRDDEITDNGHLWTLSGDRTKNGRPHTVPLTDLAIETLESVARVRMDGAPLYVFSTNGRTPVQAFDNARNAIAAQMTTLAEDEGGEVEHWTFHDLRRTCATTLARLRISQETIEAILNHVSGSRAGVAGVYNRYHYLDEKAAALNAWSDFISETISDEPESSKVVTFKRRDRRNG